jgi:hypothetical protein
MIVGLVGALRVRHSKLSHLARPSFHCKTKPTPVESVEAAAIVAGDGVLTLLIMMME